MAQLARVFVSSAGHSSLRTIRETLKNEIAALGHFPVLYETPAAAPWGKDPTRHCLELVSSCDLLILLVNEHAGSLRDGTTVTHLEFKQACADNKQVIVFVEKSVLNSFFSTAKGAIESFFEQRGNLEGCLQHLQENVESEVEPYVWLMLYDVTKRGLFCQQFSVEDGIDNLASYLSDYLRQGLGLLPLRHKMIAALDEMDKKTDIENLFFEVLSLAPLCQPEDWGLTIATIRQRLTGGQVCLRSANYVSESVARFENCSAITIYRLKDGFLDLILKDGVTRPSRVHISVEDRESYVAETFRGRSRGCFFNINRTVYVTDIVGETVICYHFPMREMSDAFFQMGPREVLGEIASVGINQSVFRLAVAILAGR